MKIYQGRITGWKTGDKVRVTKTYNTITRPAPVVEGTVGTLGCFYRIQDGVEMWQFWVRCEHGSHVLGLASCDAERVDVIASCNGEKLDG